MIIQLNKAITKDQMGLLEVRLTKLEYIANHVKTQFQNYIVCVGKKEIDLRSIGGMQGIQDIHRVSDAYKLVSKKWKLNETEIDLEDGIKIGNGNFAVMTGPCSIESEDQIHSTIKLMKAQGVQIMRGGVYLSLIHI